MFKAEPQAAIIAFKNAQDLTDFHDTARSMPSPSEFSLYHSQNEKIKT